MFFFNKPKDKKEYYFGLFLKGDEATGFVFEISDDHFSVLHHETVAYSNGWENIIQDIDDILSKLETTTRLHLKKVIFFLYSHFIDDATAEINQPYKNIIKTISKELELQPLGYIECNEAVAQYLERRDKSPLNVILVEIDKTNVDICVYKGSRKVTSKTISRTTNLVDDLTAIFTEVKTQTLLPSRLVLYDSSDLDDESVKILGHRWDKDIFIQHPRVEVIKRQDLYTELGSIFFSQLKDSKGQISDDVKKGETGTSKEIMGFTIRSDDEVVQPQTAAYQPKVVTAPFKLGMPKMNLGVIGLLLIVGSLALIEYRFHTATLTIILPSQKISKQIDITDLEVTTATTSSTVNDSIATTGKRDVGEKARGEVTMHNFEDSVKLFTKGTTLEVDGHSFTLDQDVSVASSSETLSGSEIVKQAGKTKTSITAEVLGPESNLEKGKRFKIADESTSRYFAVNEGALSGGSKKSIRTVAKKDIDDLKKTLVDKGKKQAVDAIKKNLSGGTKVLDTLTEAALVSSKVSKEVGEESDKVSLTVEVSATYYSFDDSALKEKLTEALKKDIPSDFEMDTADLSYSLQKVEQTDNGVSLSVEATETASKKISPEEVATAVKGKSKGSLAKIIEEKTKATGYNLDIGAPIPGLNSFMPFLQKNIVVKTTSE